ncbi:MAG: UvrD-helicase domain-containing protein [Gammaproteobacteria bacterium]|nr:UvrD-helicase domain-containing protein [Gammaproteobacteria bacterium]
MTFHRDYHPCPRPADKLRFTLPWPGFNLRPMTIEAANPAINATVTASAGSGKTWMLVTRILRLLLDDAEPGGIMALTFTRKAAGEMQQRLFERLFAMATADDDSLDNSWQNWVLLPMTPFAQKPVPCMIFINTVITRYAPRPFIPFARIFLPVFHWKRMYHRDLIYWKTHPF